MSKLLEALLKGLIRVKLAKFLKVNEGLFDAVNNKTKSDWIDKVHKHIMEALDEDDIFWTCSVFD